MEVTDNSKKTASGHFSQGAGRTNKRCLFARASPYFTWERSHEYADRVCGAVRARVSLHLRADICVCVCNFCGLTLAHVCVCLCSCASGKDKASSSFHLQRLITIALCPCYLLLLPGDMCAPRAFPHNPIPGSAQSIKLLFVNYAIHPLHMLSTYPFPPSNPHPSPVFLFVSLVSLLLNNYPRDECMHRSMLAHIQTYARTSTAQQWVALSFGPIIYNLLPVC